MLPIHFIWDVQSWVKDQLQLANRDQRGQNLLDADYGQDCLVLRADGGHP